MMTDVACFCGCLFSFDGGEGACPRCGEVASVTSGRPEIPLPVTNGIGQNGQMRGHARNGPKPAPRPALQRALFMTAVSSWLAGHYAPVPGTDKGAR
jgi:hypothetical protein